LGRIRKEGPNAIAFRLENINQQVERLRESSVQYTERAPSVCYENGTDVQIYVILAKRIHTPENKSVTDGDLVGRGCRGWKGVYWLPLLQTIFGNELAKRFGLDSQDCKDFLLLIGIEAAKLAYVRVGIQHALWPIIHCIHAIADWP